MIEAPSTISLTTSSHDKNIVINETDNDITTEPNVLFTSIYPDFGTDESDILLTTIDSEVINKEVLNINNDILNLDTKEITGSVLFTSTEGNNLVEDKTTTAQTTTETTQQPQSTTQTTQQPQTTSETTTTTTTERTEEGGLGDLAFSIATQGNEILNSVFRTIFGLG